MEEGLILNTQKISLSKIQEQFWVLSKLRPSDTAYNIPLVYKTKVNLDVQVFKEALRSVLNNHNILRAHIELTNNTPYFITENEFKLDNFFTSEKFQEDYSRKDFEKHILEEIHQPFNIVGDKLLRVKIFHFNDSIFVSIVFHHIIIDLHSKHVFIDELSNHYNNLANSIEVTLNSFNKQYAHYSEWQHKWLASEEAEKMRIKWKQEFHEVEVQPELSFLPTNDNIDTPQKRLLFSLPTELSNKIDDFSNENNIKPFVFLLSAYSILLSRLSNQEQLVIGVPLSNRRQEEFKDTIGCFVNILPVSMNLESHISHIDFIKQVRVSLLKTHRKQEIPYIELVSMFKHTQQTPLIKFGFTFEEPVELNLTGVDSEHIHIEREGTQLDLFLTLWNDGEKYMGFWEHEPKKMASSSIDQLIELYVLTLESIIESPSTPTQEFDLLTNKDKNFIIEFNQTDCDYENDICIHQKFEKQVDQTPNAIALTSNEITLTYKEVDDHVNILANYLISENIVIGDIVAICCERSIEMMIGILATLKAGATYLPLQIDHPVDRMNEIIDDARPKLILSTPKTLRNIHGKGNIVMIDDILFQPLCSNNNRPNLTVKPNNLAYILYTSGSTGKPKGTLIEHHSVLNRIGWMQKSYPLSYSDTLLQKTPVTFDVSVWELFWWFFNGSKLVLSKENEEKDPNKIVDYIEKFEITQIHFVPSMFSIFISFIKQFSFSNRLKSLKYIFLSGEALSPQLVASSNELRKTNDLPFLVNLYGPTEATVDVSYYNCPIKTSENDKIYIGKPIDNTGLYIVNPYLKTQPIGVKGELIITGVNLSKGYLNNKELTNKCFVSFYNPNGEIVRAYKTGDIAILTPQGEIDYIGRIDNQLKIRGMRIELGEIESKLQLHPKIINAAVTTYLDDEHKFLIAYICLKSSESLSLEEINEYISTKVPSHMVPSQYMFIDSIPLTTSGKLNRKALPLPAFSTKNDPPIEPSSNIELELLTIWKQVLRFEDIGITDNFFDIGGNSLLAIELATKISDHFNKMVTVISVLEHTNIRDYAKYLNTIINDLQVECVKDITSTNQKRKKIVRKKRFRLNNE